MDRPSIELIRKKYYNRLLTMVTDRRGKCLSNYDKFIDIFADMDLECILGHKFSLNYLKLACNSWCSACGKSVSFGDIFCRNMIEHLLGVQFDTFAPEWLKYEGSSHPMIIGSYNDYLKLAVEYFPEHHYKEVNGLELHEIQLRDKFKEEQCIKNHIKLIIVPFDERDPFNCIIDKLEEYDIPIIDRTPLTDAQLWYRSTKDERVMLKINSHDGAKLKADDGKSLIIYCGSNHTFKVGKKHFIHSDNWCELCKVNKQLIEEGKSPIKSKATESTIHSLAKRGFAKTNDGLEIITKSITQKLKIKEENSKKVLKTKQCGICKQIKSVKLFGIRKDNIDGYKNQCKECCANKARDYRSEKK